MEEFFAFFIDMSEKIWPKFKQNLLLILLLALFSAPLMTPWLFIHVPLDSVPFMFLRAAGFVCAFAMLYASWNSLTPGLKTDEPLPDKGSAGKVFKSFAVWLIMSAVSALLVFAALIPYIFFNTKEYKTVFFFNFLFVLFPFAAIVLFIVLFPFFILFIFALFEGRPFISAMTFAGGLCRQNKKKVYGTFAVLLLISVVLNITIIGVIIAYPFATLCFGQLYLELAGWKPQSVEEWKEAVARTSERTFDARRYKGKETYVRKDDPKAPFEEALEQSRRKIVADHNAPTLGDKDISSYLTFGKDKAVRNPAPDEEPEVRLPQLDESEKIISVAENIQKENPGKTEHEESVGSLLDISYEKDGEPAKEELGADGNIGDISVEVCKDEDEEDYEEEAVEEMYAKPKNIKSVSEYGVVEPKKNKK